MKTFIALLALAAAASAQLGQGGLGHGHHGGGHYGGHHDTYAYPAYKYSYGVSDKHTGDQKSASEVRDGGVTKGTYSLVQPDGVLRTVNYISTPHGGFQAQVINKGHAGHPAVYGHGHGIGHGVHHGGHHGGHAVSHVGHHGIGGHGLGGVGYLG